MAQSGRGAFNAITLLFRAMGPLCSQMMRVQQEVEKYGLTPSQANEKIKHAQKRY